MRIALVTPGFSADDDDWCIPALQDLACGLQQNHDVQVYAMTYPHRVDRYLVKGVKVSSFGNGCVGWLSHGRRIWRTIEAIEADHRLEPFDVLHGFWADQGGIAVGLAARRLRIPTVVTVMAGELTHEPLTNYGRRKQPLSGRLGRAGARYADVLTVNSEWHAERLAREQNGLAATVVPRGVNLERFSEHGESQALAGQVAILCVASLVPVKSHDLLLRAFAKVTQHVSDLHLHLVGEGELATSLHELVAQLGIQHQVTFHGHVGHDRIGDYYRGAGFCVLSSSFESLGMVVLEAAACGKITIGTSVGALPHFCPQELLSPPGDELALARNIQLAATNANARRAMIPTALKSHSLRHSISAFEALYAQTLTSVAASR